MQNKKRLTFRKVITSSELIEQINPENQKLVDRFLKDFSTKRSPKSVLVYKSNYNIFFCYVLLYCDNKSFIDLKKFEILDFFDFGVTELKWSPNRFHQMHSSLCSLSDWIENVMDEYYPNFKNIVKKIEKPAKELIREKSVFTKDELYGLMNWLGEINKPQEQCLLSLMMGSGARADEFANFTTDLIDENNLAFEGLFLETTNEMRVKGRGVNGKRIKRYIIKDVFLPYYKQWLPIREQIMKENGIEHNYIFVKSDGEPATTSTIRSWMEKWDKPLSKHFYPHSTRHYWCTTLLAAGLEAELVQELQQWGSSEMLNIYNDATAKDRKWKGLAKLRAELEKESFSEELNKIQESNNN